MHPLPPASLRTVAPCFDAQGTGVQRNRFPETEIERSGHAVHTIQGVPQGGVISPLLANVVLHELDRFWEDYYSPLGQLIRYAEC